MDSPHRAHTQQLIKRGLDLDWERLTCFLLMLADGQSSDRTHIWGYWVLSEDGDWGPYLCTLPLPYSSQQVPSFCFLFLSFHSFLFLFFWLIKLSVFSISFSSFLAGTSLHSPSASLSSVCRLHFLCAGLQSTTVSQRGIYTCF